MIGGFLKIVFSRGWFSTKLQFSITNCLSFFAAGWYVVTKGNILSAVLCNFCGSRADCLEPNATSDRELSLYSFGYSRASRRRLKFARHSSNVISSLIASPFIKPLITPGWWHKVKWVCGFPSTCSEF